MTTLGKRLTLVRHYFGYSQEEMANKVDRSLRGWQTYERGTSMPGGEVFQLLYNMGVNLNWLFSGEGEMMRLAPISVSKNDYVEFPEDEEACILMHMPQEDFWEIFGHFGKLNASQEGWSQMEIIRRFPEFRKWLRKNRAKAGKEDGADKE